MSSWTSHLRFSRRLGIQIEAQIRRSGDEDGGRGIPPADIFAAPSSPANTRRSVPRLDGAITTTTSGGGRARSLAPSTPSGCVPPTPPLAVRPFIYVSPRLGPSRSFFLLLFLQRKRSFCHQKVSRNFRDAAGGIRCSQLKLEDGVDDEACELVSGVELVIGEGDDSIRAYLLKAVKNNNGTGILLLSDVFGFEDSSTREFAYRVACSGYNVLVPDMFRGNPWRKGQPESEFEHWISRQFPERVANDIAISSQWLVDEFVAAGISRKLGAIGFCFGGRCLIETFACDEHAYFGTGVCFYGTNMNASLASNIKAPLLFICGDGDPLCPVSVVRDMEKNITDSKVVVYPGRGHGFAHRPESQEEDNDAEDAFAATRTWMHDCLIAN